MQLLSICLICFLLANFARLGSLWSLPINVYPNSVFSATVSTVFPAANPADFIFATSLAPKMMWMEWYCSHLQLRKNCPNTEYFLVRILTILTYSQKQSIKVWIFLFHFLDSSIIKYCNYSSVQLICFNIHGISLI